MFRRLRPACALLLIAAGGAPAGAFDGLRVAELELPNGFRVLTVDRPHTSMVAAGWMAPAGSADDPAETTGLGHLVEHLMFKGTDNLRDGELSLFYSEAGAVGLDASTLRDLTFYWVTVPVERLELWFWLEADRLRRPLFRDLEREKEIVAEERKARIEAAPTGPVDETVDRAFWSDSPYAWPPLGRGGDLAAVDTAGVESFFRRGYRPDRLTAVLVGALDPARVAGLARRYLGSLPAPEAPPPIDERSFEAAPADRRMTLDCSCPDEARVLYPSVPFRHPDSYPLQLLSALLSGSSGRLHRSLVVERQIAFSASARQHPLRRAGEFVYRAVAAGGAAPADLVAAWDDELAALLASPIPAEELERARNGLLADGLRRLADPAALMKQLLIYDGLGEWREVEQWPDRIQAVTGPQIRDAARRHLRPETRLAVEVRRRRDAGRGHPDGAP
ncbi:MAG: pitrilysin family protein [Thermoanaerobaculia bacterium]|nr:pitrilysin family protein [Thermoanaerobaculia bacterium]